MKKIFHMLLLCLSGSALLTGCYDLAEDKDVIDRQYARAGLTTTPTLSVTQLEALDETSFSATLQAADTASVLEMGLAYTTEQAFTSYTVVAADSVALTYEFRITKLQDATTYYARAYAYLANGTTVFSEAASVTTPAFPPLPDEPEVNWTVFAAGTMTETWWGEEERETLYYTDLGNGIRYCYISDCFDTESVAEGEEYEPVNYYFYWNTETNEISIPPQYMGYTNDYGPVYFSDALYYFILSGDSEEEARQEVEDYGFSLPYYDGNGGFYLADFYYFGDGENKGQGYNFGEYQDVFIADGFTRRTDFNTKYTYETVYYGDVSSEAFASGTEPAVWHMQTLGVSRDEKSITDAGQSIYYLEDYFAEDIGLAFAADAPETLEDGAKISPVENDQKTGVYLFGYELYANVKGGSVSFGEDQLPVFTLYVDFYTKDADGETILNNFGTLTEIFTATGVPEVYTLSDIGAASAKSDYYGNYSVTFNDRYEGGDLAMTWITLSDGGADEESGTELVAISGLSGYSRLFDDTFYAEYDEGLLYVTAQLLDSKLSYQGEDYVVALYPYASSAGGVTSQGHVVGGLVKSSGKLAFVGDPEAGDYNGFYFTAPDLANLSIIYNVFGEKETEEVEEAAAPAKVFRHQPKPKKDAGGIRTFPFPRFR